MSSAICQNFVQNAWKKELCSNCFKSKDEHNQPSKPKVVPINTRKSVEGILKSNTKRKSKRNVAFLSELTEVIGYGGEEWSDTEEEFEISEETFDEDEFIISDEEEKELKRLTKANTDFNTVSLNDVTDTKKSYASLLLGKPQVDSEGKKQTLLVTVTPFGQDASPPKKSVKPISHIPIAKNHKDTLAEIKSNVVLTSYTKNDTAPEKEEKSLLDEISETLENSKNPIQIVPRKKIQKEIVLTVAKPQSNKENIEQEKTNTENDDKNNDKTNKNLVAEKKTCLQRTPGIKRDQEKPAIYQTSVAKIELLNSKNLKHTPSKENLNNNKYLKSEFNKIIKNEPIFKKEDSNKMDNQNNERKEMIVQNVEGKFKDCNEKTAVNQTCENAIENNKELCNKSKSDNLYDDVLEPVIASSELVVELKISQPSHEPVVPNEKPVVLPSHPTKIATMPFPQSRELAGEPDGRADPDENTEPPALPLTPPPAIDNHTSFLHGNLTYDKPKVPSKPTTMIIRKPVPPIPNMDISQPINVLSTFSADPKPTEKQSPKLVKRDSNGSDIAKSNKRKAPKPPSLDENNIYLRNAASTISLDVVNDCRERLSYSPKIKTINDTLNGDIYNDSHLNLPEPAPRKSLSMSTDCLSDTKKQEKSKGRFSLKRFWRMGASKELAKVSSEILKTDESDIAPQPKPRLVIVHPLDLNGEKVEVVAKPVHEQIDYGTISFRHNDYAVPSVINNGQDIYGQRSSVKPPPPPRNLDDWNKPSLPHPPKSQEIINRQKMFSTLQNPKKKTDTVYANIGEVRSAIVPNKPQRTASMREREAQQQKMQKSNDNYECISIPRKDANENVYDYINSARSSSPECDSSPGKSSPTNRVNVRRNGFTQRSESNVDVSGDEYKYQNIPRSLSLTYCGSETESEIYSPYSFYGSESEVAEDDHEWPSHPGRTHKLRSKKGRSIVHKNLEDNYGAVVVANHEALAQVLENIQHTILIQPALRGLKTASNLRWSDFSVKSAAPSVIIGSKVFHQAMWGSQHVTLIISTGSLPSNSLSLGTFSMIPITEFSDILPSKYLSSAYEDAKHIQASIAVFPWMQVHTVQSYGDHLRNKHSQNMDDLIKEGTFILLQLVNALKTLQAQGVEELPETLSSFVLCKEMEKETHCKLYVLQGLGEDVTRMQNDKLVSLCSCASKAIKPLLGNGKLTLLIQSLLDNERAVSLTQVKSVLEFSLWGPSDVTLGSSTRERELALQRWLDLQRATVLHGLVCTKVQLTVYEECHLLFLVRSTAKMISDASLLLESLKKEM